jgi:hypothetical protein
MMLRDRGSAYVAQKISKSRTQSLLYIGYYNTLILKFYFSSEETAEEYTAVELTAGHVALGVLSGALLLSITFALVFLFLLHMRKDSERRKQGILSRRRKAVEYYRPDSVSQTHVTTMSDAC